MASMASAGTEPPVKRAQTNVDRAFALGWHVAELTYLRDDLPPAPLVPPSRLKQVTDLGFDVHADLLLSQICKGISQITDATGQATIAVPTEIQGVLKTGAGKVPLTLADLKRIPDAHETILKDLTAADYRLGKAYALGASIGETVLLGYKELLVQPDLGQLPAIFDPKKIARFDGQLRELKTEFEDHAADAVSATLLDWSDTVDVWGKRLDSIPRVIRLPAGTAPGDTPAERRRRVADDLYKQGTIWRSLLSGEKEAADYLHLFDYVKAIGDLLGQYAVMARRIGLRGPTLAALVVMVLAVAVGTAVLALVFSQQVQAVYTALIGLIAALGITGATITASVRSALATAEDKLWETELSAAIAEAIDWVPVRYPTSHVSRLKNVPRAQPPLLDLVPTLTISGAQKLHQRPILLGKWVAISMVSGLAVISLWAYVEIQHGVQFIDAVSVAASAGACYIVSILALIAVVNFIAWIRKTAYVWALPTNLPRFRTDWLVPAAVAAGVIIGKLLWL